MTEDPPTRKDEATVSDRRQQRSHAPERGASTERGSGSKGRLNRREYLKVGAASVAAVVGGGAALATTSASAQETTSAFATDFSEYVA